MELVNVPNFKLGFSLSLSLSLVVTCQTRNRGGGGEMNRHSTVFEVSLVGLCRDKTKVERNVLHTYYLFARSKRKVPNLLSIVKKISMRFVVTDFPQ